MLLSLVLVALLAILVIALKVAHTAWKAGRSNWTFQADSPALPKAASDLTCVPTKIVSSGQEYSGLEKMPADVRQSYDQAPSTIIADSIPDASQDPLKALGGAEGHQSRVKHDFSGNAAARLKKLDYMRTWGLITDEEYEARRTEIFNKI